MTPQTYELTTFSTCVVFLVAGIFFWLLVKLLLSLVGWLMRLSNQEEVKQDRGVNTEEKTDEASEDDEEELPDLETKKAS